MRMFEHDNRTEHIAAESAKQQAGKLHRQEHEHIENNKLGEEKPPISLLILLIILI